MATAADPTTGSKQASIHPMTDLAPGPYTVNWTSLSSDDGHTAEGFYTFVVNGGPTGIIDGTSQAQSPAADMMATLTVTVSARRWQPAARRPGQDDRRRAHPHPAVATRSRRRPAGHHANR